ncbi:lysophospholipid acyltransferase family protein [Geothrix sp. PMB-07]|uniref:lysophospholipid acyltransferase family protein n=1 Tax=Geothrix sp. PMB-07 TaxID=3068640 RepID=UPI00274275E8|nr:lysophospholipid acyltransferase family protein [Geothrix sp. PMB-07]WLT32375.1 lysophospholipid acyltransferase family protein [Geothrix sp. PMB-07]
MNPPQPYPIPPAALRQDRGWFWRFLGRAYLKHAGWRVEGPFPEATRYVAIVAPHTSNWDFPLGVALMFAVDLRVSWLGKHSLFKPPFRRLFRWLGGIPVDRRASHGVVGDCVKAFETTPHLLLGLAPEGTRKGVSQWRTGFYQIATGAQVPILPVAFDFKEHVVRLMPLFQPSGSLEEDLPKIQGLFRDAQGLRTRPEA